MLHFSIGKANLCSVLFSASLGCYIAADGKALVWFFMSTFSGLCWVLSAASQAESAQSLTSAALMTFQFPAGPAPPVLTKRVKQEVMQSGTFGKAVAYLAQPSLL